VKHSGTHILLVEDDRDLAAGLTDALELEGYRVTLAADGSRASGDALFAPARIGVHRRCSASAFAFVFPFQSS